MAVGSVRALLVARTQAIVNRLQREAGGSGLGAAILVGILGVAAVAAPTFGSFLIGRSAGQRLARPGDSVLLTVTFFHIWLPVVLGTLGGLFGADSSFCFSRFVSFPIPPRQLLLAELLSSSAGLMPILAATCLLASSSGLATAQPALTLPVLLLAAQSLLLALLIQYLIGGLRTTLLGHLRWLVVVGAVLAFGLLLARAQTAAPQIRTMTRTLSASLLYLPIGHGCRGLVDFAQGRIAAGLLRQLTALGGTALLFEAVVWIRWRLRNQETGGRPRSRGARLWSFRHPAQGVARLFVLEVLQSRSGRLQVFMPAFITFMVAVLGSALARTEVAELAASPLFSWVLALQRKPWLGMVPPLCVAVSSELWLNQFGWDSSGVKSLFLLPISGRDLLLGKLLGLVSIGLLQLALALLIGVIFVGPPLLEIVWGLGAGVSAWIIAGGMGHVFSAGLARRLSGGLSQGPALAAMLAGAFTNAAMLAVLLLASRASEALGIWGPPLGLWLLALSLGGLYWRCLPFLASRVVDMRETIQSAAV